MRKLLAAAFAALLLVGLTASSAGAQDAPDCSKETYAVVAAAGDAAMAELIASWQVLDTKCVVEPGDAKAAIDSQQVVVLGGTKAVPDEAVAGLNVIARLAGADRVETARAVLAWIDNRQQGNLAAVARTKPLAVGSEHPYAAVEHAAATFTVGKDIQAGLWRFSENSGKHGEFWPSPLGHNAFGYHGGDCLSLGDGSGAYYNGEITVNETGDDANPFEREWRRLGQGVDAIATTMPFKTYAFELVDGDTITLRALSNRTCEIERHSF